VTDVPITGAELLTESPQDSPGGDVGGSAVPCQLTATVAGALVLPEALATTE
jgi:hypothetical protein